MIRAKIISFTARGAQTGARIADSLSGVRAECYARGIDPSLKQTALSRMVQQAMVDCDAIIFVGATGIAVRSCAPYLQGKQYDPAILVVDENGRFVISLLSGHLGGANMLTERLADALGAQAVITTATDGRGAFAVDTWAAQNRCAVHETKQIRYISGAILANEPVGIESDFPLIGNLPNQIVRSRDTACGIVISPRVNAQPYQHTLHLIPRIVHIGIGCRRGTSTEKIAAAVTQTLDAAQIPLSAVCQAASIDLKQDELGICLFCSQHQIPFVTYPAQVLRAAKGNFTPSAFVQDTVGVDNVCERAAVISSGNGTVLRRKTILDGVTVALAVEDWRAHF